MCCQSLGGELNMAKGIMTSIYPILGYCLAIAVLLIIAGLSFMATVSASLVSAGTTMASIIVLVALLVGITSVVAISQKV